MTAELAKPIAGLVLAGRRGAEDPLARVTGASHRALVPVHGIPMLLRVVHALREARSVGSIAVSIDDPTALDAVPELREQVRAQALELHQSASSPSASVSDVLSRLPESEALLATTADHPLLTAEIVDHFAAEAMAREVDVAVGMVTASVLLGRFPEAARTFLRLRGERFTGANLFLFRGPQARRVTDFWSRAERFRKRPWRLVSAFGPLNLALFLLGRLDLEEAFARVSRVIGARVGAVPLPFPEAAIDVDKPADLELVSRILAAPASEGARGRPR